MRQRLLAGLVALALAPMLAGSVSAQLTPYSQDFELLVQGDPAALAADGWLVFGNVFTPDGGGYVGGYGPFPAPNGGAAFSAIDVGQGGPPQGAQQLSIYNDYNNGPAHFVGNLVEANVFQEQVVDAADVGSTWVFRFDAKRGNINDPNFPGCPCSTTAIAFIKTLDPANGFALTNFITLDTTNLPTEWGTYELSIVIDGSLPGQILQIGYASTATYFQPSGVFYDNIDFAPVNTGGACCTPLQCTEVPVGECVGEYQGDGTTCDQADCTGPLFITLCHTPGGNPANRRTITVGLAAAPAHINHGDTLGACVSPGVAAIEQAGVAPQNAVDLAPIQGLTPRLSPGQQTQRFKVGDRQPTIENRRRSRE